VKKPISVKGIALDASGPRILDVLKGSLRNRTDVLDGRSSAHTSHLLSCHGRGRVPPRGLAE